MPSWKSFMARRAGTHSLLTESQSFLATASVIGNEPDTALLQRLVGRDEEQVAMLMEKA